MTARPTYAPSGRANLADLWPYAALLFAVAGLLAVVYAVLTGANAYAVGWVLVVPAILKTWLCHQTVRNSHCRNAPLAAALLGAAGLAVFLGNYHVDQCLRWGIGWHRLDLLPGFVTFRMETDAWWGLENKTPVVWPLEANPQVVPHRTPRVQFNLHWGILALEFGVTVAWPAAAAWAFARRPYSETLRAWYREEAVVLTPDSAAELKLALPHGTLDEWAELHYERSVPPSPDHPRLFLWRCPRPSDRPEVEPEIYLTLGRAKPALLTPEEVAALVEVFPSLADWAEIPHELRPAPLTQTPPPRNPALPTSRHVPPPHAGRCQEAGFRHVCQWVVIGIWLSPLLTLFGSMILGFALAQVLLALRLPVGGPFALFFLAAFVGVFVLARSVLAEPNGLAERFKTRYHLRAILGQARRRDDALFDPDRRGVMAVELLPRRIWNDTGAGAHEIEWVLLLIDVDARRVLFEGDRYRWVIPFAAIRGYEVEVALVDPAFHAVVLSFDTADGRKELPLVAAAGLPGADRFERTAALHRMLDEAVGEPEPSAPAVPASNSGR